MIDVIIDDYITIGLNILFYFFTLMGLKIIYFYTTFLLTRKQLIYMMIISIVFWLFNINRSGAINVTKKVDKVCVVKNNTC